MEKYHKQTWSKMSHLFAPLKALKMLPMFMSIRSVPRLMSKYTHFTPTITDLNIHIVLCKNAFLDFLKSSQNPQNHFHRVTGHFF